MARKTAIQKREQAPEPVVEVLTEPKGVNYPVGRMLIASPKAVAAVVRGIPQGKVMTMGSLRKVLALTYGADYTCPLTTGIFLRIAAEAAIEEQGAGKANNLPYWRVVRDDGKLLEKLPGGPIEQVKALKAEGHAIDTSHKVPKLTELAGAAWMPKIAR